MSLLSDESELELESGRDGEVQWQRDQWLTRTQALGLLPHEPLTRSLSFESVFANTNSRNSKPASYYKAMLGMEKSGPLASAIRTFLEKSPSRSTIHSAIDEYRPEPERNWIDVVHTDWFTTEGRPLSRAISLDSAISSHCSHYAAYNTADPSGLHVEILDRVFCPPFTRDN